MTHTARGGASDATRSFRLDAPVAPSFAIVATASALRSVTDRVCPARIRRRTMFEPIRPRPTIPSCM